MLLRCVEDRLFSRWCRRRDGAALARWFDRVAPEVAKVALFLTRDAEAAEELVQRTFLAVLEGSPRFDVRRGVMPWVMGVLVKQAHRLRRERREVDGSRVAVGAPPRSPVELAAEQELIAAVQRVRERLQPPYREVLRLHLEHGLPAAEIAEVLARNPDTVRKQIARGLELVRGRLPRGFAMGVAAAALDAAAWRRVRAAVLTRGGALPAAALVAGVGGSVVMKTVVAGTLGVLLVLALVGGGVLGRRSGQPAPEIVASALTAAVAGDGARESEGTGVAQRAAMLPREALPQEARGLGAERATLATLRLRLRRESDGRPAAAVAVQLKLQDASSADPRARTAVTDADGRCCFDGMPAGKWLVLPFLGEPMVPITLGSGETRDLEVPVSEGVEVSGIVVDASGEPAAHAAVTTSSAWDTEQVCEVMRSDASGRFAVTVAARGALIGARKAGYVPSSLQRVVLDRALADAVTLQLGAAAGMLRGTVRNPAGEPVAGARVCVGSPYSLQTTLPGDRVQLVEQGAWSTRSDEDGAFVFDDVAPGSIAIVVGTATSAPWTSEVDVIAGGVRTVEVRLQDGGRLRGRVVDARGRPVSHAEVGTFLGQRAFEARQTSSDRDGRYELAGLPISDVTVQVRSEVGRALATLRLTGDRAVEWSPVLGAGAVIRGRVLGPDGAPRAGLVVEAEPVANHRWLMVETDAEGAFTFRDVEPGDFVVSVHDAAGQVPWLRRRVTAGEGPVELRLDGDHVPSASILARIVGPGGEPVRGASLWYSEAHALGAVIENADPSTGSVRLAPLVPRRYLLTASAPGFGRRALGAVTLARDGQLDLGVVTLQAPAVLDVDVMDVAGAPLARGQVSLLADSAQQIAFAQVVDGHAQWTSVPPGDYLLQLAGGGAAGAGATRRVTVKENAHFVLQARRATAGVRVVSEGCDIEVRAADGRLAWQADVGRVDGEVLELPIDNGVYEVRGGAVDGATARATLKVDVSANDPIVDLVLR